MEYITSGTGASNGLAEQLMQSVKMALKTSERNGRSHNHRLCELLLTYRNTPHAATGASPALLVQRELCTRLDLLKPNQQSHVVYQQAKQKQAHIVLNTVNGLLDRR